MALADGVSHGLSEPVDAQALREEERGGASEASCDDGLRIASGPPGTLMPLGQFRDTFIVAVDEEGIAIIDQHVAHERMLFERITERLTSGPLESQRLLEPMLVEVAPEGHQALLAHAEDLARLGFEVEDFGADAVRVSACPALLSREESRAALRELAEDLEQLDRGRAVVDAVKRIAATMACHAAVKANYPLTHEKMLHILDGVRRTAYSTVCPHGRPVMLQADAPRAREAVRADLESPVAGLQAPVLPRARSPEPISPRAAARLFRSRDTRTRAAPCRGRSAG